MIGSYLRDQRELCSLLLIGVPAASNARNVRDPCDMVGWLRFVGKKRTPLPFSSFARDWQGQPPPGTEARRYGVVPPARAGLQYRTHAPLHAEPQWNFAAASDHRPVGHAQKKRRPSMEN